MRIHLFAWCFLGLFALPLYSQGFSPEEAEAVKVITTIKHVPFYFIINAGVPASGLTANQQKLRTVYNNQLSAIAVIGKYKTKKQVINLIPFLDYVSNGAYLAIVSPYGPAPSVSTLRDAWPAYAVIVDLPDAATSLKQYCLDKRNPLNSRVAVFLVLRDVDKDSFASVSPVIDTEPANRNPKVKAYVKSIEDGSTFFWGVRDLSHL
jgi:hypothetical protein